jgi:hypothetical protein
MQMNKLYYEIIRATIAFALFVFCSIFCGISYAGEQPKPGWQYKIVRPVYLSGIYLKLNNRQLNKQSAVGSLTAMQFSGPEVGFQCKVPAGTIMTIIGSAPKRFPLFFLADQYFIKLDPDLSSGLDVVLELNRGMEGSLDGLNPEIFSRQETRKGQ